MRSKTLLPTLILLLSTLASCTPTTRSTSSITIDITTSPGLDPNTTVTTVDLPLYQLTPASASGQPVSVSKLSIDPIKPASDSFDLSAVECRAYKDVDGLVVGSAPFTLANPALISTNLGSIGSLLCYIVQDN